MRRENRFCKNSVGIYYRKGVWQSIVLAAKTYSLKNYFLEINDNACNSKLKFSILKQLLFVNHCDALKFQVIILLYF